MKAEFAQHIGTYTSSHCVCLPQAKRTSLQQPVSLNHNVVPAQVITHTYKLGPCWWLHLPFDHYHQTSSWILSTRYFAPLLQAVIVVLTGMSSSLALSCGLNVLQANTTGRNAPIAFPQGGS